MNKIFLMLVFVLLFSTSCAGGKNTTYSFEPEKFHTLQLEENSEAITEWRYGLSTQITDIAPDFSGAIEKIAIDAPAKVTINTFELNSLVWEHAKVPVCIRYRLGEHSYPNITDHHVFLKEIDTDNIISVPVDLDRYDGVERPAKSISQKGTLTGGTLVYNITYFTDLPKYSAEYEVWVKIAGLESNHVRIKIDLKENGRLVTRD